MTEGSLQQLGLLTLRMTPKGDGLPSPAQLAQGRSLWELMPVQRAKLLPQQCDGQLVSDTLKQRQVSPAESS